MSDYVTLLGAEQVTTAASSIREAASSMAAATSALSDSLHQHRMWMDQWLADFRDVVERLASATQGPDGRR